ncbi:C1QL [Mytilus edulis]|uniref:C1QL n=1 Tax=Mytilus edulis TaxID=6550 RepID=A0A8S3QN44_MYTED|nr:C1QL [Mytilus edulis]
MSARLFEKCPSDRLEKPYFRLPGPRVSCANFLSYLKVFVPKNVDKPAFFAFLKNDVTSSGTQVIKFHNVNINKGNYYNPTTGIFTAPRQGIYQISCTIVGYGTGVFQYQITLNGKSFTLGNTSTGGSWNSQTSTVLMDLKQGDRVYVESRGGSQKVHANSNSYFSGYLLQ